jgi:hypothetical protein
LFEPEWKQSQIDYGFRAGVVSKKRRPRVFSAAAFPFFLVYRRATARL